MLAIVSNMRTIVKQEAIVPHIKQYPGSTPADYPTHLEREFRLPSGEVLWMRPIVPADAEILAAEFAAADDDTVYSRFFTPSFDLTEDRLRYLTELDYKTHLALAITTIGGDGSEGVAIGRYAARTATDVEGAVVVKPAYRRLGIARILVDQLVAAAAGVGYNTMSASYLADNAAAARLLDRIGFTGGVLEDGIVVDATRRLTGDPATVGSV